jgi:hypothetical protein
MTSDHQACRYASAFAKERERDNQSFLDGPTATEESIREGHNWHRMPADRRRKGVESQRQLSGVGGDCEASGVTSAEVNPWISHLCFRASSIYYINKPT